MWSQYYQIPTKEFEKELFLWGWIRDTDYIIYYYHYYAIVISNKFIINSKNLQVLKKLTGL